MTTEPQTITDIQPSSAFGLCEGCSQMKAITFVYQPEPDALMEMYCADCEKAKRDNIGGADAVEP